MGQGRPAVSRQGRAIHQALIAFHPRALTCGARKLSKEEIEAMSKQAPKPNDQRSNVKNPNNPAYRGDRNNRIEQGHRDVPPPPPPPQAPKEAPKK